MVVITDDLIGIDKHACPVQTPITFALAKNSSPLVDEEGKTTVMALQSQENGDDLAKSAEAVRFCYQPVLEYIDGMADDFGVTRKNVVMAWYFKKQPALQR